MTCCRDIDWCNIRLSVDVVSSLTWNAAGREGGLLVPKLAKERGSKAVGDEQSPKASTSAALLYAYTVSTPHAWQAIRKLQLRSK